MSTTFGEWNDVNDIIKVRARLVNSDGDDPVSTFSRYVNNENEKYFTHFPCLLEEEDMMIDIVPKSGYEHNNEDYRITKVELISYTINSGSWIPTTNTHTRFEFQTEMQYNSRMYYYDGIFLLNNDGYSFPCLFVSDTYTYKTYRINGDHNPEWRAMTKTKDFSPLLSRNTAGARDLYIKVYFKNSNYNTTIKLGSVYFEPLHLSNFYVDEANVQKRFFPTEEFNYDGLVAYKEYSYFDNSFAKSETTNDYSVTAPDTTYLGIKGVLVTCSEDNSFTDSYNIEVTNDANVVSFSSNISTLLEGASYPRNTVNFGNLTATIVGEGGSEITKTRQDLTIKINGNVLSGNSYSFPAAGEYDFSVSYLSLSEAPVTVTILPAYITSISETQDSEFQDEYIEEQRITKVGLKIEATYNNGDTSILTEDDYSLVDENGNAFGELPLSLDGENVYVKFGQLTPIQVGTLDISEKEAVSILVEREPLNKTYTFGDMFNAEGLVVRVFYNNGKDGLAENYNLSLYLDDDDTDIRTREFASTDTVGTHTISVVYGELDPVTFSVSIVAPELSYLTLGGNYQIEFDEGDAYDRTGMIVYGHFSNGYSETLSVFSDDATTAIPLALENGNYVINTNLEGGIRQITITAGNPYNVSETASVVYEITVNTVNAVSAVMEVKEGAKDYFVGETFTAKEVYWILTDVHGVSQRSNAFKTVPEIGTVLRSGGQKSIKVLFTLGEKVLEDTYIINVSIPNKHEYTKTDNYQIAMKYINGLNETVDFEKITHEEATILFGEQKETYMDEHGVQRERVVSEYYPLFHEDLISVDVTSGKNVYIGNNAKRDCIGYMDLGLTVAGVVVRNAHVVLFDDPVNPIDGQGNIEVLFPHYVEGYADKINKCRFGTLFNNRLFVSGNPEAKNCDWHSGDINVAQIESYNGDATHDYSYFSDLDYCFYGTDDTAIVGYDIFRDGDLIVFKEDGKNQATMYKRTFKLITAMSADGSVASDTENLYEEAFPMFDINSNGGLGAISHRSIANVSGETIVLTKEGLKSLSTDENIKNNAKYSFDISTRINNKILEEGISKEHLYVFGQKLLLKTDRGLYIGYYELKDNYEYEWYFVDNIEADMFFEYEDELYFANDTGRFYRFKKDSGYIDTTKEYIEFGGATPAPTLTQDRDVFVVSKNYADYIAQGRRFHLSSEGDDIYAELGNVIGSSVKNNIPDYDESDYVGEIDNALIIYDNMEMFYDGRVVYFDNIVGFTDFVNKNTPYKLKYASENTYTITDMDGNDVSLAGVESMRISYIVGNESVSIIGEVSDYGTSGAKQFELIGDHNKPINFIYYDNITYRSFSAVVTIENNVVARFVTVPFSFGSLSNTKTITSWSIVNDTAKANYLDVGYVSSRNQGKENFEWAVKSSSGSVSFDMSAFDFAKVQFDSDYLPNIYTRYKTLAAINFIRFIFSNEGRDNAIISNLEVTYKLSQFTKGAK